MLKYTCKQNDLSASKTSLLHTNYIYKEEIQMKKDLTITHKVNPAFKRLCKVINSSSYRKTLTLVQALPGGKTGFTGNEYDLLVANLNPTHFNCEIDISSNNEFLSDITKSINSKKMNSNSLVVIELKLYDEKNRIVASALLFLHGFVRTSINTYEFVYQECSIIYADELFKERSNLNGR